MTPKEKAKELVSKCKIEIYNEVPALQSDMFHLCILKSSKHCSLIAVDEIMEFMKMDDEYTETSYNANSKWVNYWLEVKQEIEKL
jgi:hypothetical protein